MLLKHRLYLERSSAILIAYYYVICIIAKSAENIFNYLGNENCYTANLDILLKASVEFKYIKIVQAVTQLSLRKKFYNKNVLVMLESII
ncbi:hypothetical protein HBH51_250050 [Parastagonospora nodorum]|nr:hypothetical protein HBH51_250050 [Parastagonospora nodorum]